MWNLHCAASLVSVGCLFILPFSLAVTEQMQELKRTSPSFKIDAEKDKSVLQPCLGIKELLLFSP